MRELKDMETTNIRNKAKKMIFEFADVSYNSDRKIDVDHGKNMAARHVEHMIKRITNIDALVELKAMLNEINNFKNEEK